MDNSPASYHLNPGKLACAAATRSATDIPITANGIPIEGWTHDPKDEALLDLLPVLDSLRFAQDVRHILSVRLMDSTH